MLDPDPVGTHSKKKRNKGKMETAVTTSSTFVIHIQGPKTMESQYAHRVTLRIK